MSDSSPSHAPRFESSVAGPHDAPLPSSADAGLPGLGWGALRVPEWLVLVALCLVVNLAGLGQTHFWDDDETYFAAVAREMHLRQDWVVPWFNGELFSHKPPMMFWLMAGSFRLLGVSEFAARLPAALFGVATVLLVWRLGSRLFGRAAGFWAGCVLATSLNYVVIARAAACDAELTFFCTLALAVYARWAWPGTVGTAPRPLAQVWPSRGVWGAVYACMGLAVLTKGPIGVLLPGSVLGLFLLGLPRAADPVFGTVPGQSGVRGWLARGFAWLGCLSPRAVVLTAWRMHPGWALLMVLLVSGPWFVWVGLRTDGEFLRGFFGTHHFHRFTATMDNHAGPPWFYLAAICVGFFPWILLLRPAVLELIAHWRRTTDERPALLLLGAWVAVWVGFFSLATTKFPHYVVPAYPALALAAGRFLSRWPQHPEWGGRIGQRLMWSTLLLVGLGLLVVPPVLAPHLRLEARGLWWPGLAVLTGGVLAWHQAGQGALPAALRTWVVSTAAFLVLLFGVAAVQIDRNQSTIALTRLLPGEGTQGPVPVAMWHFFRPGMVYYTGEQTGGVRVERLETIAELQGWLERQSQAAYVFTRPEDFERERDAFPGPVEMLA
ncbi:MAG: ArnT family glycosyltransferase, partial [Planctomycetaceae bacterium]